MKLLFLLIVISALLPDLTISGNEVDNFDQVSGTIKSILEDDKLSDEQRAEKLAMEIKKLAEFSSDIDLSKEEVEKLSTPLSEWNNDLMERIKALSTVNQVITKDDIIKAINESSKKHPELANQVTNILKSKDQSKVKKFFSDTKSMFKRLGHKLKEKFKIGWRAIKWIVKNPKEASRRAMYRIGYIAEGLFGLVLIPIGFLFCLLTFKDDSYFKSLGAHMVAYFAEIFEAIFRYHFDDVEKIGLNAEIRKDGY